MDNWMLAGYLGTLSLPLLVLLVLDLRDRLRSRNGRLPPPVLPLSRQSIEEPGVLLGLWAQHYLAPHKAMDEAQELLAGQKRLLHAPESASDCRFVAFESLMSELEACLNQAGQRGVASRD